MPLSNTGLQAEERSHAAFSLTCDVANYRASSIDLIGAGRARATKMSYQLESVAQLAPGIHRLSPHNSHFVAISDEGAVLVARYPTRYEDVEYLVNNSSLTCWDKSDPCAILAAARTGMFLHGASINALADLTNAKALTILLNRPSAGGTSVLDLAVI